MSEPAYPPLLVIAGGTATGKTGLSLHVAERLRADGSPAEIVSADSRQVYRGMDIGTAKVSGEERARVPHHGLDLVDPDQSFSLADYVRHARHALTGIAGRRALALLVGGTGLYLRAVTGGLDPDADASDPDMRAQIDADLDRLGLQALARELADRAPTVAARTDLANPRRVVRALERARLRGDRPPPPPRGYPAPVAWVGLRVEPDEHRRRIAERAARQFASGLLDEAAGLAARYPRDLRAFSAFGYREAMAHLAGEMTRDEALAETIRRTNSYAKRQRTWFRSEASVDWLPSDRAAEMSVARATALAAQRDV